MKYFTKQFTLLFLLYFLFPIGASADGLPYAVGQIPYETGTTQTGGFTVSIPISTLPCPGTVPSISLVYNSQGGEGVAGYGWDIAGLSAITLGAKNQYFDGRVSAPDPSQPASQVFTLDGSRLVNGDEEMDGYPLVTVSGDIWACAHRTGAGHVSYFTAICPDHSRRTYGFADTTHTQLTYPVRTTRDERGYFVRYNYSFRGNRYYIKSIEYGGLNAESLPFKLVFGYSSRTRIVSGFVSGNEVRLDSTLTNIRSFNGNQLLGTYTLLHKDLNGRTILEKVDYESYTGEKLPPLTFEYGADGNPTAQGIVKERQLSLLQRILPEGNVGVCHVRGHFLKDSYSDGMLEFLNYPTYNYSEDDSGVYRFFSPYPADKLIRVHPSLDNAGTSWAFTAGAGFQTISAADIDGDGKDEVVKVNFGNVNSADSTLVISVLSFLNEHTVYSERRFAVGVYGVFENHDPDDPNAPLCDPSPMSRSYYFGDFIGNGKTQLLTVCHRNDPAFTFFKTAHLALIDLETEAVLCDFPANNLSINQSNLNCFSVMDLDGDGKVEFHDLPSGDVYAFDNNSFHICTGSHTLPPTVLFSDRSIWGDINADGLPDYIVPPGYSAGSMVHREYPVWFPHICPYCNAMEPIQDALSKICHVCGHNLFDYFCEHAGLAICYGCGQFLHHDPGEDQEEGLVFTCPDHGETLSFEITVYPDAAFRWTVYTNTGKSFIACTINSFRIGQNDNFQLMDVNRDGYMDLFRFSGNEVSVHVNDGGTFRNSYLGIPLQFGSSSLKFLDITQLNAFKASHVVVIEDDLVSTLSLGSPDEALLTGLADSFGNTTRCAYSTAYDAEGPYSPTTTPRVYPLSQRRLPVPLLAGVQKYMDGDTTALQNQSYRYAGSVVSLDGRGFLSFDRTEVTDSIRNWTATTRFDPTKRGTPTSSLSPASETWFNYSVSVGSDKREKILLHWQGTHDVPSDKYTESEFTYDQYGYPVSEYTWNTWYGDPELDEHEPDLTVYKSFTYGHDSDPDYYRLGLLTESRTSSSFYMLENDEVCSRETYEYDSSGRPVRQRSYAGYYDPMDGIQMYDLENTVTRTYDSYSNVLSEQTARYGSTQPVGDTFTYSADGRTLASSTDAFGLTTAYSGYDRFNHPASATDHHNRTTSFTYDFFGNRISTVHPDASVDSTVLAWGGIGKYTVTEKATGAPDKVTHYDALGREIRTSEKTFDGLWRSVDVQYDSLGRKWRTSLPFRGTQPVLWNEVTYDGFDRQTRVQEASGKASTWTYGLHAVTSVIDGVTTVKRYTPSGFTESVTDAGGTITFHTRPDGQTDYTTVSGGGTTSLQYDLFGRRTRISDPSDGVRTTAYTDNADGSSRIAETNARGTLTTCRDKYGRTTRIERTGAGGFSTEYTYNLDNQLLSERSSNGTSRTFQYDTLGRVLSVRDSVPDGKWLLKEYTYGPGSRIANIAYTAQSGFIDRELYAYSNGYNTAVRLSDSTVVWSLTAENDLGLATQGVTGPITRTYGFTPTGLPISRSMTCGQSNFQHFTYLFDPATGNLLARQDAVHNQSETFGYDALNRLTTIGSRQITYAANGNVRSIDGAGTMAYTDPAKPYNLTSFNPGPGVQVHDYSTSYSAFDRPSLISEDSMSAVFSYDAAHDRVKMDITNDEDPVLIRYYIGGRYELDVTEDGQTERLYVGGDAYSAPAVLIRDENGSDEWEIFYIGRDYLGSITHITDADGVLVAEYSYDPWGRLRDPGTLVISNSDFSPALLLGRGFTGHEHLPWFGLINMNARLYDPLLGRFLAPDPFIQDPESTQNFNRYSYALNNPLKYTDESGEFIFSLFMGPFGAVLDAACWGAVIGGASYTVGAALSDGGFNNWSWSDFGNSVGIGALSGAVTFGVGEVFSTLGNFAGTCGTELIRGVTHGLTQGGISSLQGGDFWCGFASGMLGSWTASGYSLLGFEQTFGEVGMLVYSAVAGGISSEINGSDFWKGACIGLVTAGFNHLQHKTEEYKFFDRLRRHYSKGNGEDFIITGKEFYYLISKGKIDYANATLGEDGYYTTSINFYDSGFDLKYSFGNATVKFYSKGMYTRSLGFYDKYDFDAKPWGTRSMPSELITRGYGGVVNGTSFDIYYRKSIFVK